MGEDLGSDYRSGYIKQKCCLFFADWAFNPKGFYAVCNINLSLC